MLTAIFNRLKTHEYVPVMPTSPAIDKGKEDIFFRQQRQNGILRQNSRVKSLRVKHGFFFQFLQFQVIFQDLP
jgi:hypothetical protein